eukprot:s48_g17.t1
MADLFSALEAQAAPLARVVLQRSSSRAMAFAVLPIPLIEVIKSYDITTSPYQVNTRANVLLTGVQVDAIESTKFTGQISAPRLYDHRFMTWHTEVLPKSHSTNLQVEVSSDHDLPDLCNFSEVFCHNLLVKQTDPPQFTADRSSLLIPWDSSRWTSTTDRWTLEQFSGGYGGWSFGMKYIDSCEIAGHVSHKILSIESHLPYATQHALTHGSCLIGNPMGMPDNFMHQLNRSAVIVTTIQDICWQRQLQYLPVHVWSISAPCVSWSTAASQDGFWSPDGLSLAHAIGQTRIFKPPVVALEQVAGFEGHEHHNIALRMLAWAGYHMIHSGVFDLSTVTPCRRNRWLGILSHVDRLPSFNMNQLLAFRWPSVHSTVRTFDAIRPMPASEALEFEPSVPEASVYFDPNFMPGRHKVWTKRQILEFRIPSLDGKLPTFMSKYGQQHTLRPHLLSSRGLFGHFLRSGVSFRYWSPGEIALLHGQAAPLTILKPKFLGWETIGNCIATPHAIFALAHALNILDNLAINPTTLVEQFIGDRFKTSNSAIQQDQFAWYLGKPQQIDLLKRRLHFFLSQMEWNADTPNQWPANTFFSPVDGILGFDWQRSEAPDIPETIQESPFSPHDDCIEPCSPSPSQTDASQDAEDFAIIPKLIPGEYGVMYVSPQVKVKTLMKLWNQPLSPDEQWQVHSLDTPISNTNMPHRAILSPMQTTSQTQSLLDQMHNQTPDAAVPLLHRTSTDLTLYEIAEGTTWRQIKEWQPKLSAARQDIFGDLQDHSVFHGPNEISDEAYEPVQPCISEPQLMSLTRAKFTVSVPHNTDILVLHCTGDGEARHSFLRFWMSDSQMKWYHQVGRQCNYQLLDDYTWRLLFRPHIDTTSMPVSLFVEALTWRLWKQGFSSMQTTTGFDTIIKRASKVIVRCNFAGSTPVEVFLILLRHVYQLFGEGQPSMISSTKRCTEPATIRDLFDRLPKSGPIQIHVAPPMTGGGAIERNPTAKQDSLRIAQAGVANLLLEYGMDLPTVTTATTKLLDFAGLPRIHSLLQMEAATEVHRTFKQLCAAAQIELPKDGSRLHLAEAKLKKLRTHKQNRFHQQIDVKSYQLEEGFFLNHDSTTATINSQFSWHTTGVCLMAPDNAVDLLTTTTEKAPDELAIYVVGDINIPHGFDVKVTNAPAFDAQGRRVLLNGKLIQLGQRHIRPQDPKEVALDSSKIQVMAVTLWKGDYGEKMWDRLCQAPVKTTKDLLALEGYQELLGKPWGRAYRSRGLPVEPSQADSIQFHAEFQMGARLQSLLKRSGFNRIYLTPKSSDGTPDDQWKVIWLAMPISQIESKSASLSGAAGLVRGTKSVGLRIEAGAYQQAWIKLKPDQSPPDGKILPLTYRIQPFPAGTDKEVLIAWATTYDWTIKPLRPVGAKQWLISSEVPPPALMMFNSQPLLVQQVINKPPAMTSAIAAGPRPRAPKKMDKQATQAAIFKSGDPFLDPWSKQQPVPPNPNTLTTSTSTPSRGTTANPARQTDGPIREMFQQQDTRISAIETAMTQLQTAQQQRDAEADQKIHQLGQTLSQHMTMTSSNFEQLYGEQKSMSQSLAAAFQRQDERLASSMDELKSLFLQTRGTKRPPNAPAEEMEDQE